MGKGKTPPKKAMGHIPETLHSELSALNPERKRKGVPLAKGATEHNFSFSVGRWVSLSPRALTAAPPEGGPLMFRLTLCSKTVLGMTV